MEETQNPEEFQEGTWLVEQGQHGWYDLDHVMKIASVCEAIILTGPKSGLDTSDLQSRCMSYRSMSPSVRLKVQVELMKKSTLSASFVQRGGLRFYDRIRAPFYAFPLGIHEYSSGDQE